MTQQAQSMGENQSNAASEWKDKDEEYEHKLQDKTEELEELQERYDSLMEDLNITIQEQEESRQEILQYKIKGDMFDQLQKQSTALMEKVKELTSENDSLQAQIADQENQSSALIEKVEMLTSEKDSLQTQVADQKYIPTPAVKVDNGPDLDMMDAEVNEVSQVDVEELSQLKQEMEDLEDRYESVMEELNESVTENDKLRYENVELSMKTQGYDAMVDEYKNMKSKFSQVVTDNQEMTAEMVILQQKAETSLIEPDIIQQVHMPVQETSVSREVLVHTEASPREPSRSREASAMDDEDVEDLRQQLEDANDREESLMEDMEYMTRENDTLKNQVFIVILPIILGDSLLFIVTLPITLGDSLLFIETL